MSDTRTTLAKLLEDHCFDAVEWGTCECGEEFPNAGAWSMHLARLIDATHLVVPRSEIVGTEYGWRHPNPQAGADALCEHGALTEGDARRLAGNWGEAVQRPIPPWSVVPLPEDGGS